MPVQLLSCRRKFNFRPSLAMNTITKDSSSSRRFDVALSFPGEHRPFVKEVAEHLAAAFGEARVLYDDWYDAEFARLGLDVELPISIARNRNSSRFFFIPTTRTSVGAALNSAPSGS